MRLFLDPLGGIAGDMFAAAVLDAFPELADPLREAIEGSAIGRLVELEIGRGESAGITGTRFVVRSREPGSGHAHRHLAEIERLLGEAGLEDAVVARALAMFDLLAEAEGRVHGVAPSAVAFHEVGAWDSIADFVAAAWLVERLAGAHWICAPLPLGRGRIATAHGRMPVPAPATALLLEGVPVAQDEAEGERVTPTGAAIVRHLEPDFGPLGGPFVLRASGAGLGTAELAGMPNLLRLLVLDEAAATAGEAGWLHEAVAECRFEVDDQSPEDLAVALDRIRAVPGVLDATQSAMTGKKGRLAVRVEVLARPGALDAVRAACLRETSTLGVRSALVERSVLPREALEARADGAAVRVKRALRPGGAATVKAEVDDLARAGGDRAERERRRRAAEDAVARRGGDER